MSIRISRMVIGNGRILLSSGDYYYTTRYGYVDLSIFTLFRDNCLGDDCYIFSFDILSEIVNY